MVVSQKQGFTLVEMLVVMAITGLLLGGIVVGYTSYTNSAKNTKAQSTVQTLNQGITAFYLKAGKYPASLDDLIRKPADMSGANWGGPYIGKEGQDVLEVPLDPWDNPYEYSRQQNAYTLYSWGKNGPGSPEDEWIR